MKDVLIDGSLTGHTRFEDGTMPAEEILDHIEDHVRNIRYRIDTKQPVQREDVTHAMTRCAMLHAVLFGEEGE